MFFLLTPGRPAPAKLCRRPEERPAVKTIAGCNLIAVRGTIAAGRPGSSETEIPIKTELFFYSPRK